MSLSSLKKTAVCGSDLPYADGLPMESSWHLDAMYLLIRILEYFWRERNDIYLGGNMFVYFDPDQVRTRNFRGPDFFVVKRVTDTSPRKSWVIWEEGGLTPDFVVELASPSTASFDLEEKREIYEQVLATPEYVTYNPETDDLRGWRLIADHYEPIKPNEQGWLWCSELGLWLGVVEHQFLKYDHPVKVLRFFDEAGQLIPTAEEAEAQARRAAEQRAEAEIEARQAAEAEIARLRALLAQKEDQDD